MKLLEIVIHFLQIEMTKPTMYGCFHLLAIMVILAAIILADVARVNIKRMLLAFSIIMFAFELYKQFSFSFSGEKWVYQWYAFPFQFCSTPMYVALIAGVTGNEKLAHSIHCFLATYGLSAGIAVMAYPSTVFTQEVLINVQTMVHHGLMVVMGVLLILYGQVTFNVKTLISAFRVFIVLVTVAVVADIITNYAGIGGGLDLFFISPFHASQLPVFDKIYSAVPYPIFLLAYLAIFTVGGILPLGAYAAMQKRRKRSLIHGEVHEKMAR